MGNTFDPQVLHAVLEKLPDYGLELVETRPDENSLVIRAASGTVAQISLASLTEYYAETGDEKAPATFVACIAEALTQDGPPDWEEARGHIHHAMCPRMPEEEALPFSVGLTPHSARHFILETPSNNFCLTPNMLEQWGITEEDARQAADENGDRLLAETELVVQEGNQGVIGYFALADETLNAALLLAPSFGARVRERFGWPLYAIIPNTRRFCIFSKDYFEAGEESIREFVEKFYNDSKCVTPELLEVGPDGIHAVGVLIDVYGDDEDDEDE